MRDSDEQDGPGRDRSSRQETLLSGGEVASGATPDLGTAPTLPGLGRPGEATAEDAARGGTLVGMGDVVVRVDPELGEAATVAARTEHGAGPSPSFGEIGGSLDRATGPLDDEGLTDEHPDRYVVGRDLGAGGIGRVYVAVDKHLGREVALKELLPAAVEEGGSDRPSGGASTSRTPMELRFVNEARVTGQLEHPGIVPVYELGRREDGTIYYAMRLVRGRTLGDELTERDLRARLELLPNFVELCQAVAYAHSRGVVHRDLKPDNVMVGDFGETVVLDWGLAKVRGQRDVQSRALVEELERLTHASAVETVAGLPIGTPSYMPPEQALGELAEIDERSDVYALGAVLYQLLTGEPPFTGKTALEVIRHVVRDDPVPPTEREPECPPELAAIALRALDKEKGPRYRDAAELAKDVRAFLTGGLVHAHQYSWSALLRRWVRRHRLALAMTLLALGVGGGAWIYRGHDLAARQAEVRARSEQRQRDAVVAAADRIIAEAVRGSLQPRWLDTLSYKLISLAEPVSREALEDRLIAALGHEAVAVRRLAARSLGGLGAVRAVEPLCSRLAAGVEPVEDVTIEVINALGVIGDARAEIPVRKARWSKGQYSRLAHHTELAFRMIPLPPVPPEGLSAEAWADRARSLQDKGDVDAALEAFTRAIEQDRTLAKAYNNRAIARTRLADYEGALADYNKALELDPKAYRSLHNRAIIKRHLGDFSGALTDHERVIELGKTTHTALRSRAITHRVRGDFEAAMADCQRALQLKPNDARVHFGIAVVHLWQRDWEHALGAFGQALARNPEYTAALEWRGITHQITGDHEAALADYDRVLDLEPSRDLALRGRASLRLAAGDRKGAKADLDLCIDARCPDAALRQGERWAQRGIIYHAELGEFERALADVEQAAEVTRNADERVEYKILTLGLGLRLGQAVTAERALAGLEPRHPGLFHSKLARVLVGDRPAEPLLAETIDEMRRCYVRLAAGIRAELDGHGEQALEHYREAGAAPRPIALACVLGRVSGSALAGE